jgi:hypothetical protein
VSEDIVAPIVTQLNEIHSAKQEILASAELMAATGVWLDEWAWMFGLTRANGESDDELRSRITVIGKHCNNIDLQLLISSSLQVDSVHQVSVVDSYSAGTGSPCEFDVIVSAPIRSPSVSLDGIVSAVHAAGTRWRMLSIETKSPSRGAAVIHGGSLDQIEPLVASSLLSPSWPKSVAIGSCSAVLAQISPVLPADVVSNMEPSQWPVLVMLAGETSILYPLTEGAA